MNSLKPLNLVLTTILWVIFSNTAFSQKIEPKERTLEPDHTIISSIMEKDYQLHISFPANYSTKDTITYPVLYVLDGGSSFQSFQSAQKFLSLDNRIEDVIIIGINGPGRIYDYSPSIDTISERDIEEAFGISRGTLKSGGGSKFLNVIKTEIVPFVEKHYKTNSSKGIAGHSLGGLFTAYCLVNSDGYFTRFGISSPALYWNKEELLDQFITDIDKKIDNKIEWNIPPTKVFISVGALEGSSMVPAMVKLSTYLEELNSDRITLEWQIFENEAHISVIPLSLNRTLSVLYGKE